MMTTTMKMAGWVRISCWLDSFCCWTRSWLLWRTSGLLRASSAVGHHHGHLDFCAADLLGPAPARLMPLAGKLAGQESTKNCTNSNITIKKRSPTQCASTVSSLSPKRKSTCRRRQTHLPHEKNHLNNTIIHSSSSSSSCWGTLISILNFDTQHCTFSTRANPLFIQNDGAFHVSSPHPWLDATRGGCQHCRRLPWRYSASDAKPSYGSSKVCSAGYVWWPSNAPSNDPTIYTQ